MISPRLLSLLSSRPERFACWSPFSFLKVAPNTLAIETVMAPLTHELSGGLSRCVEVEVDGEWHVFVYKQLGWDHQHFGFPVFSLSLVAWDHGRLATLSTAVRRFVDAVVNGQSYLTFNIPAEESLLIQAATQAGLRLVETRLTYVLEGIPTAKPAPQHVRLATSSDLPRLRSVAAGMRNPYDRVHSDYAFSLEQADNYLATFLEQSVKGFADYVLVPDVDELGPFGFLAGNRPVLACGTRVARLVLAAVDSSVQSGWLYRLLLDMIARVRIDGAEVLTTVTQAANRPAIRVWEKAGFRLGACSHLLSMTGPDHTLRGSK